MFGYGMVSIDHMPSNNDDIYNPEIKMIENGQIQLQKPFWEAADADRRNSPIFDVQNIRSPLLFLHGDLDMATTGLSGAVRMYNAMVRAGKTTALVHYWGQGHVAQSASAIRDQWSRIITWFDHYLKAGTQANASPTKQVSLILAASIALLCRGMGRPVTCVAPRWKRLRRGGERPIYGTLSFD